MSLLDARDKIERWRRDYNEFHPHSATSYLTPAEFARNPGSEAIFTIFKDAFIRICGISLFPTNRPLHLQF
jgi:putative transposase